MSYVSFLCSVVHSLPLPVDCGDHGWGKPVQVNSLVAYKPPAESMLKQESGFTSFATDGMTQAELETQVKYFNTRKEEIKIIS